MEKCIFCEIVKGNAPSMKVYEDDFTLAFMDIAKDVDGHILVIPKEHCENMLDCTYDALEKTMDTVKRVSNHLTDECGYDGVDILNANGKAAGQTVPHFHMHIIPRRQNDGLGGAGQWPTFHGAKYDLETMHRKLMMLKLVRPTLEMKQAGMTQLQLSVERDNEPSVKTIINNGGVYKRSFEFQGESADVYMIDL